MNWLIEPVFNAFDPLYVDSRNEFQKKKDRTAWVVVICSMVIAITLCYIFE